MHLLLNNVRDSFIVWICRLSVLKKYVRILSRSSQLGVFWVHTTAAEVINGIPVHQLPHVFIINELYLLDLHGGPEAIKKVDEGKACTDACKMGHKGQVHDFLDACRSEQRETSLSHSVDI